MHRLIQIHTRSKPVGNIYYYGKISGNFLLVVNFRKIYNPTHHDISLLLALLLQLLLLWRQW